MSTLWVGVPPEGPWGNPGLSMCLEGTNPPLIFPFQGADVAAQYENIQLLAQAMTEGSEALATNIFTLVTVPPGQFQSGAQLVDVMFSSDELIYGGEIVIDAAESGDGATVLDMLEEAGELLAEALA